MNKTRNVVIALAAVATVSGVVIWLRAQGTQLPAVDPVPVPPAAASLPPRADTSVQLPEKSAAPLPETSVSNFSRDPTASGDTNPVPENEWERKFQEEMRDEAWARPLENEIQKSLQPGVNQARFYIVNVECRTTLCEIRLQARGSAQIEELDLFDTEFGELPWVGHLNAALSSSKLTDGEISESLWIFEKKPEARAAR